MNLIETTLAALISLGPVVETDKPLEAIKKKDEVSVERIERELTRLPTARELQLLGDKGNGGDAIVCRNKAGEIISAELLDHFEWRQEKRLGVASWRSKSLSEYIEKVSDQLASCHPHLRDVGVHSSEIAEAFERHADSDAKEFGRVLFVEKTLGDVKDSKHKELELPEGCQVEQVAIRLDRPDRRQYFVSSPILSAMNKREQAGLVLHEAIYATFGKRTGIDNSYRIRRLVGHLGGLGDASLKSTKFCSELQRRNLL
jgi:hypothetical protein